MGGGGGGLICETFQQVKYSWGSGGAVSPPAGPGQSPSGGLGGKAVGSSEELPEVVKKSTLVGHFFYVLYLKVTEKIIKIQNKVHTFS